MKTTAQQELVARHRIREQWMSTRTARINALRGFFREHGIPRPAGARAALAAVPALAERLPAQLALAVTSVYDDVRSLEPRITGVERQLAAIAKEHDTVQRLLEIPGVGLLTATALVGSVGRISAFRRARQFASWLGLTPRDQAAARKPFAGLQPWAVQLAARKGHNQATIAVANKLARTIWAVWARDTTYTATPAAA